MYIFISINSSRGNIICSIKNWRSKLNCYSHLYYYCVSCFSCFQTQPLYYFVSCYCFLNLLEKCLVFMAICHHQDYCWHMGYNYDSYSYSRHYCSFQNHFLCFHLPSTITTPIMSFSKLATYLLSFTYCWFN